MAGRSGLASLGAALALVAAPVALAGAPSNDPPTAPAAFEPYSAANGSPREQQAEAHLAEATADPGVPRCLGRRSFLRTVWYRVPEAATPQEVTVEAFGRTLGVLDLAAFVQPEVPAPPPPPPPPPPPTDPGPEPSPSAESSQTAPLVRTANACAGLGAGGSDAAEEPTSAVTLRVPARRPLLLQVGRRGRVGSADDERAVLALDVRPLPETPSPRGDRGNRTAPAARAERVNRVPLSGATITDEDPAQPPCPSLGSVWRRFVPGRSDARLIRVRGGDVETLTVFSGRRPTAGNALDCVNRGGSGALEMVVPARRRRPLWIRIGTDEPQEDADAELRVEPGDQATVIDGGPGGSDPTPGGPGGGLPGVCERTRIERARVTGRLTGTAGSRNAYRRVPVSFRVRGASICDAEVRLVGPRGADYAAGRAVRLAGRTTVHLPRLRTFRPGRYRLKISGVSRTGDRVQVRSKVRGRLG